MGEDTNDVTNEVRKEFTIKTEGGLNDFLICEILRGEDKEDQDKCHVLQSHLVRKLVKNFGELVKNKRRTNAPGTPRNIQTVPKKDQTSTRNSGLVWEV